MALSCKKPVLVVWDFDWSMIEENSDTYVIRRIGAQEISERLQKQGLPWTALMNTTLSLAHTELGIGKQEILEALYCIPLDASVAECIRHIGATEEVDSVILSDANSVYIDTILQKHHLKSYFVEVFTKFSRFEEGALRVQPFHNQPISCQRKCPSNLCKGQVLRDFLAKRRLQGIDYSTVVYVGDGRGDYCPSVELRGSHESIVLARSHYPDQMPCALSTKLSEVEASQSELPTGEQLGAGTPTAELLVQKVYRWKLPAQLAALLLDVADFVA